MIFTIGIPISILLFSVLRDAVDDVARLRFERQASDVKGVIAGRIHSYAEILYALRALFATHGTVSRVQFHNFIAGFDLKARYPGFDSVNFAKYLRPDDVELFEEEVRRDTSLHPSGYPAFAIKPPGKRDEFYVLVYLEPMAGYEFAFGRDLGASTGVTDPQLVAAAQRSARDSGKLAASGLPIRIKTATEEYVGLAMRLPVYGSGMPIDTVEQRRAAYLGSVGAGFNVQNLMDGVLDNETARYIKFKLHDAGSAIEPRFNTVPAPERLLYDSSRFKRSPAPQALSEDQRAVFTRVLSMEVGGRIWDIHFSAEKKHVMEPVDALLPWVVLSGGIVSTALLFGVLSSSASSRTRAVQIADEITKDLRESRALLNDAQKLSHVGGCQYRPGTGRMIWSEELYRIHGVDPDTFAPSYEATMSLVHPEDRPAAEAAIDAALRTGEPFMFEFRVVRPDGTVRHLRSLGVVNNPGGRPESMLWSVLDITEQRRTEDALRASAGQLTALSRRLVEVQEAERRRLSRELHDRVGQNLTALSINLDILRTELAGDGRADQRSRLEDSSTLLESTVDAIENVMAELRPPMLDDYGLLPALHWYAREFSTRTGIEVVVAGNESAERAAPEMEIELFRIAQEALTNVAKHARAKSVEIEFDRLNRHYIMTVTDDGVGFDRMPTTSQRRGLGMATMRERSQAIGGAFEVRTMPGGGTRISIQIPSQHDDSYSDRR